MSDLGFCAPCAASVMPTPVLGDWKSELSSRLRPMVPWLIATALICGYAGWKAGNIYCSSVFLKREASLRKKRRKRKRR
jgi:hypothetical protein